MVVQQHGHAAGGLGLLMTLFLITVPPMAAAFFRGAIGQFMAYNALGQGQAMQPTRPGGGYAPTQAPASSPNSGMATTGPQGAQRNYG
jgi:type IV secretion system protein VirB6